MPPTTTARTTHGAPAPPASPVEGGREGALHDDFDVPPRHHRGTFWAVLEVGVPLALAAAYLKRAHSLGVERRPVPGWRQLCFGLGMVVVGASPGGADRRPRPTSSSGST